MSDRSWLTHFRKADAHWIAGKNEDSSLRKRHGLQGPIDDAFLDSFLMASPTGTAMSAATVSWAAAEQAHAVREWRRQFRGEAQFRNDTQVTSEDIANNNLVLWGDPSSNSILARIAGQLPIRWNKDGIVLGQQRYPAANHVLLMIFPNRLNPKKYIVLNSGVTFREADYRSNAWQIPKLPDYAIVDVTTAPDENAPGKVVTAGFFVSDGS